MTEPHMDHAPEQRHNWRHAASHSKHSRTARRRLLKRLVLVLILTGLCGSMLSGCDNFWDTASDLLRLDGNNAEAQTDTEQRVETYFISTDTFSITVDDDADVTPTFVVRDSATEFTMQSDGTASFDTSSGRSTDLPIEPGDVIVLRPSGSTGTVTIIRVD